MCHTNVKILRRNHVIIVAKTIMRKGALTAALLSGFLLFFPALSAHALEYAIAPVHPAMITPFVLLLSGDCIHALYQCRLVGKEVRLYLPDSQFNPC